IGGGGPAAPSASAVPGGPAAPSNPAAPANGKPNNPNKPGKKPLTPQQRKRRRIITIIIAAVVVVALIAGGVAGYFIWKNHQNAAAKTTATSKTTTAKPKKKTTSAPKETTEEPVKKAVSEVTMTDFTCDNNTADDWHWSGGAMVTDAIACASGANSEPTGIRGSDDDSSSSSSSDDDSDSGKYAFGVWTPELDASTEIDVNMLESGEKVYSEPVVAATYGDEPAVFVIYAVKTKAVGTTPETVHLFAHEVNVKNGKISKRIDLRTEEDNLINQQQDYKFEVLSQSNDRVAVMKTWQTETKAKLNGRDYESTQTVDHMQVMGLRRGAPKAETLQTFQDKTHIDKDSSGYQSLNKDDVEVKSYTVYDTYLVKDTSYHLYAVDSNKEVAAFPRNYCKTSDKDTDCYVRGFWRMGGGKYVLQPDYGYTRPIVLDASTGKLSTVESLLKVSLGDFGSFSDVDQFSDGSMYFQWNESDDSKRAFILSPDLKASEVLNGGQWARLLLDAEGFKGINYLTKQIYAKTTDEQIAVDENGKTVGDYTDLPDDDDNSRCDHTAMKWMMWHVDTSDYRDETVVTRGQEPGDPAPDETDDSGDSDGSQSSDSGSSSADDSDDSDSSDTSGSSD
ncbi:zinc ribbon domain-containing protein, partial [Bifidobacterium leontopitheci]